MRRLRFVVFLLPAVLGCHPSLETMHFDDTIEPDAIAPIDPEITAAQNACEDQQDAHACTKAAEYWKGENGHPFDPGKSFHFAASGCADDDGLACAILGNHYQNGLGTAWSPLRAIQIYERSCNAGIGLGCSRLSEMYAHGYGVDMDFAKAKTYRDLAHDQWLGACLGSEPRWCTYAASLRRDGDPTEHELHQRACVHGVTRGCVQVLHEQLIRPTGSRDAAMRELERWCSRGESAACEELASAYDPPNGPRDPGRAAAMMKRACTLGALTTCVRIGARHESERGVPKDDAVARQYFGRACERGASHGCLYLAQDLLVTGGSMREIAHLAQRGCEMGSNAACTLLTRIASLFHAEPAAIRWATEACRRGSSDGCLALVVRDIELPRTTADPVRVYQDACNAKIASACTRLPQLVQAVDDVLRGTVAAVAKQDTVAFAKLAANEVDVRNLWFRDPHCAAKFSGTIVLTAVEHPAFLRCLAKAAVHVEPAPKELLTISLVYETDEKLQVGVRDGVMQWIQNVPFAQSPRSPTRGASRAGATAAPPNVSPTALEALRIAGEKFMVPDDATKTAISISGNHKRIGSFKLCINAHGTVESVTVLKWTGSIAYDRKLERNLYSWRYRPFMIDGEPAPACTAVTFIYSQS